MSVWPNLGSIKQNGINTAEPTDKIRWKAWAILTEDIGRQVEGVEQLKSLNF